MPRDTKRYPLPFKKKVREHYRKGDLEGTEFTIVTLAKTLNITYLFQKMIRNPMTRQGLHV